MGSKIKLKFSISYFQCCGSGSKGSASFCRIRMHNIFHGSGSGSVNITFVDGGYILKGKTVTFFWLGILLTEYYGMLKPNAGWRFLEETVFCITMDKNDMAH